MKEFVVEISVLVGAENEDDAIRMVLAAVQPIDVGVRHIIDAWEVDSWEVDDE